MTLARIYLSIGSNIRPAANFQHCVTALANHFSDITWSPIYRSAAVGMDGDDFLNAVVVAHTSHTIESVDEVLKQLEDDQGRVRLANKFSSRTLDIDLLLYDDVTINTSGLTLPRDEITTAAHVLVPLVDLNPNGIHPQLNKSYKTLLNELEQAKPGAIESLITVSLPVIGEQTL